MAKTAYFFEKSKYIFGQHIKVTESGVTMAYMVEIARNVFVEEDPSKRCTNYPTDVFQSYKECDNWYMRNLLSKVSPDLVPIWLTDDMENVSTLLFDTNGEFGRYSCKDIVQHNLSLHQAS